MTLLVLEKRSNGLLLPADESSERFIARIKAGDGLSVEAKRARNVRFHRKFFALLNLAFETWEPAALEPGAIKSFDSFRRHLLILAGHCEATYYVDGGVRLEAKSISFLNLPDDQAFEDVYLGVLKVVWEHVLRAANYRSTADVDRVVDRIIRFE